MTKSAQKQPHAELVVLPGWADCLRVLVVARAGAQSRSPWCGLRRLRVTGRTTGAADGTVWLRAEPRRAAGT